jgi:hypothetical protein
MDEVAPAQCERIHYLQSTAARSQRVTGTHSWRLGGSVEDGDLDAVFLAAHRDTQQSTAMLDGVVDQLVQDVQRAVTVVIGETPGRQQCAQVPAGPARYA